MKIKKIISLLLVSVFTLSIGVLPALADTTGSSDGLAIKDGVLTSYDGNGGNVIIPADVWSIGASAFQDCATITSVTIPSTVTNIGASAFDACTSLTDINVNPDNLNYKSENGVLFDKNETELIQYPAGRTQTTYAIPITVTEIGSDAFDSAASLESVTIPNAVTSIDDDAFWGAGLTSVNISQYVTDIKTGSFSCCPLTSITVDANNLSYESLSGVLYNKDGTDLMQYPPASTQTSFTVPSSVDIMDGDTFLNAINLVSINADPTSLTYVSISGVLFNTSKTEIVQYPAGNTQVSYAIPNSVNLIDDYAFDAAVNLTSVTIPSTVTKVGIGAFEWCTGLTSFGIPYGVTDIADYAFWGCENLSEIGIPNTVTTIGDYILGDCANDLIIYGSAKSTIQKYATTNSITFVAVSPEFGTPKYSTTALTNQKVTVTIPLTAAIFSSVSHTFTANGKFTFTIIDIYHDTATKTVTVSNIDTTKPIIKVSIGNGKSTKGKVTVTVSDTNFKSESIKLNGKAISWSKNNTFTAKGSYAITAVDKAGNTSAASFTIN